MSLSLYQSSVPVYERGLNAFLAILDKAEEHAQARNFDPNSYLAMRLSPDMWPLVRQVQGFCDHAKNSSFRLAAKDPPVKEDKEKQISDWRKTAARYRDTDPEKHESRKDIEHKVHEIEHERDTLFARYHNYEMASAALQIGIVLASASVITSMTLLAWFGFGVGMVGVALIGVGYFGPHVLHLV